MTFFISTFVPNGGKSVSSAFPEITCRVLHVFTVVLPKREAVFSIHHLISHPPPKSSSSISVNKASPATTSACRRDLSYDPPSYAGRTSELKQERRFSFYRSAPSTPVDILDHPILSIPCNVFDPNRRTSISHLSNPDHFDCFQHFKRASAPNTATRLR